MKIMRHRFFSAFVLGLTSLIFQAAHAQEIVPSATPEAPVSLEDVTGRYPPGSISSNAIADRALEDVKRQRAVVEAQFAKEEAGCYEKFFVTSCVDAAKDRRRTALKSLNAIEIEANAFTRRARVDERDQALRARQEKQGAEGTPTQAKPALDSAEPSRASSRDIAEVESKSRQAAGSPDKEANTKFDAERSAQHAETKALEKAKEDAEAQKREESVRAYEKKQQRSLERQRKIAAQKQEKERLARERAARQHQ